MCVDPDDPDTILHEKDGGVLQESQPETKPKHPKDVRALFGVMMTAAGVGLRMPLFNYTGKMVCACD